MGGGGVAKSPQAASYLAVAANGSATFFTRVGVELFEAGHAVRVLLPQDVLLAVQRLVAVVAVKAVSHVDTQLYSNLRPKEKTQTLASGTLHAPCLGEQGDRQTFNAHPFQ